MGIWASLSQQGSAEAEFGLGLLFDLGNGTPADPKVAFSWYRMAAEAGMPEAEFNVAAMYDAGRGVVQSPEDAALWYARAAAHGHHRAQFDLGLLYEHGEGVPRNLVAAAAWFRAAADGGLAAAKNRLKAVNAQSQHALSANHKPASVTLAWPQRGASVTVTDEHPNAELVWIAPPEPRPAHYEVQVHELGPPSPRVVYDASTSATAAAIPLSSDAFYVWKVDAVAPDGSRMPGDWGWFSVGSEARSEPVPVSPTAAPQASR
jgi:TPR repeat protein